MRTADSVPVSTRGFDAGKKVKGRKRFMVADTRVLPLAVGGAASIQDHDGTKRSLLRARIDHPSVLKVWADQGFPGRLLEWSAWNLDRDLEIARRMPDQ